MKTCHHPDKAMPPNTLLQDLDLGISPLDSDDALLDELCELTVSGIRRRAPELDAAQEGLRAQIKELASASCGVFIESADCVKHVHNDLSRVARQLEALEAKLPQAVHVDDQRGIDERRCNVTLLAKHAELLEVLEQPQLMDTCVRNGFVDEALELENAARSRAIVHSGVPIIAQVAAEVSAAMGELRESLLNQLAGPLQLPTALRIVGYLRRLGSHALSEQELRIVFLRNRTIFFAQAEAALPRDSPASFLLKYIDLCRVHWYDAITHYRAVFSTAEAAESSAGTGQRTPSVASRGANPSAPRSACAAGPGEEASLVERPASANTGATTGAGSHARPLPKPAPSATGWCMPRP